MSLEQKTIIDQIEITRSGVVQVRLGLLTLKDGVEIASTWHRTSIEPGQDVDATMAAVNTDITTRATLMAEPIDVAAIPQLKSVVAVVHTPDVVAAFQAAKQAQADAIAAAQQAANAAQAAALAAQVPKAP